MLVRPVAYLFDVPLLPRTGGDPDAALCRRLQCVFALPPCYGCGLLAGFAALTAWTVRGSGRPLALTMIAALSS